MDSSDTGGEVFIFHAEKTSIANARGECFLAWKFTNRFNEILIGGAVLRDLFAKPWDDVERIGVIGLLQALGNRVRKLQTKKPSAGPQYTECFAQGCIYIGDIANAKRNCVGVGGPIGERQSFGVTCDARAFSIS